MRNLLVCIVLLLTTQMTAQTNKIKPHGSPKPGGLVIYDHIEQQPEPGYDIDTFFAGCLTKPADAAKVKSEGGLKQGQMVLSLIVKNDGSIDSVKVIEGLGKTINDLATTMAGKMPPWKPGRKNGKAVNVRYQLKINIHDNSPVARTKPALIADASVEKFLGPDDRRPQPSYNMNEYLEANLRYPDGARDKHIEGRVVVRFVVKEDGSISDVTLVKGIYSECDAEAMRVFRNMPPWIPGKKNGKIVSVFFTQPLSFKLE